MGTGVIETNYHVKVGFVLFNHAANNFCVHQIGNWIIQMIFKKISTPIVEEIRELDDIYQGASSFESTRTRSGPVDNDSSGRSHGEQPMNEEASTQAKSQDPIRINSLKRLSGSNKPHILIQTTESK